jgi:lipoprotein signal peptidase
VVVGAAARAPPDLIVKANVATPWWAFHHRSHAWVVLSLGLFAGVLLLAMVRSRAVALAAGVMCGGVLGNLVSARRDHNWVPNPLTVGSYQDGVAFNLADVFFLVGNLLLMTTLIVVTVRNRDRLIPPRQWERALRRRLRNE